MIVYSDDDTIVAAVRTIHVVRGGGPLAADRERMRMRVRDDNTARMASAHYTCRLQAAIRSEPVLYGAVG